MPRYFIQLAYNGTNYNGWQVQDNTPNTVQQILQEKLSMIIGHTIEVVGCGRTDAGVHAKDYYAHFDSEKTDLHETDANYVYKLNKVLPFEIAIKKIIAVKGETSARFDAEKRTYEYLVHRRKDPFLFDRSLYVFGELNVEAMNEAAAYLLTVTDFTSFSKVNTQAKTNNCDVTFAQWIVQNDNEFVFKITANRFLRNMVRAIVGTLLEIGKGKMTLEEFKTIVGNKNRSDAGMSAACHALYLTDIQYPSSVFNGN
ncbi:MAG: truA [Bacteroidetes bacterium]|jgi:tRNA pseudouridine38-40 synthase|nr:truA [Bacteroidota bacterium]MDF2452535.1 truA [Bacteroidota bacterium]